MGGVLSTVLGLQLTFEAPVEGGSKCSFIEKAWKEEPHAYTVNLNQGLGLKM